MHRFHSLLVFWLAVLVGCGTSELLAQQVTVNAPTFGRGNSFYENFGLDFGFQHVGAGGMMFFRSANSATPAFGGFTPGAGNTFGFGGRKGNFSWNLGITASQGSDRSYTSTVPSLTLPNGGSGFISNSTMRPFVMGFTPVVGREQLIEMRRQARQCHFNKAAALARQKQMEDARSESEQIRKELIAAKSRPKVARTLDAPLVMTGASSVTDSPSAAK